MEMGINLMFEVHARRTKRGFRYRVKHTNYPGYITEEMTETQTKAWLHEKYVGELERQLKALFHPTDSKLKLFGNSCYGIGRAHDLESEWDA